MPKKICLSKGMETRGLGDEGYIMTKGELLQYLSQFSDDTPIALRSYCHNCNEPNLEQAVVVGKSGLYVQIMTQSAYDNLIATQEKDSENNDN